MKYSKAFIHTERIPNEKLDATSHKLCIQAGLIHQVSAGLYNFMPLGNKVLQKIETVIRQELDAIGCQEIAMPIVQPRELWVESERWNAYGKEMLGNSVNLNTVVVAIKRYADSFESFTENLTSIIPSVNANLAFFKTDSSFVISYCWTKCIVNVVKCLHKCRT